MLLQQELRRFPFLRLVIPLIIGILIGEYFSIDRAVAWIAGGICLSGMLLIYLLKPLRENYDFRGWFGLITTGVLIAMGIGLVQKANTQMLLPKELTQESFVIGYIHEPPLIKEKSVRSLVNLDAYQVNNQWKKLNTKVMVYFKRDSLAESLMTGDQFLFTAGFQKVKNAGNPEEFNYARYLKHKHTLYQCYVDSDNWEYIGNKGGIAIKSLAMQWRRKLLGIYRKYGIQGEAYSVLSALTLGYRQEITSETRDAWASAGAMHVLAVSGLHVGIIYLILNTFLKFLSRYRWGKLFRAILLLASLWFYVLLTGASPSVMRAATMFSFIVVGTSLKRTATTYNSLACSAFFLLFIDPFFLFSVGFQLSYLAVLSIVFFQPRIYGIWSFENWFIDKTWALTTVSIAAQIGTFPLACYYFHQFPVYFLLTNLVVIPFAGIMIYLATALFVLAPLSWIAKILAFLLEQGFNMVNHAIIWIGNLPGAVWKNIYLGGIQAFVLYLIIILLILFVWQQRRHYLFVIIGLLIAMQMPPIWMKSFKEPQSEIVVYNIRGHTIFSCQRNDIGIIVADSLAEPEIIKKRLQTYLLKSGVDSVQMHVLEDTTLLKTTPIPLVGKEPIWIIGKQRLAVLRNHKIAKINLKQPIRVDYLILGKNINLYPHKLQSLFEVDTIILDASNASWYRSRWRDSTLNSHLWLHDVQQDGAFMFSAL